MNIQAIIVDDEKLARERIRLLLKGFAEFHIAGECANGAEALKKLNADRIDLMFLDIQMPELDGIALLEKIPASRMPVVIFTTAYDSFAVKAFELNAVDYLLKPFSKERFRLSVSRAKQHLESGDRKRYLEQVLSAVHSVFEKQRYLERVVVKAEGRVWFLPVGEVQWVESEANYLKVHAGKESPLIRETLTHFGEKLDPALFLRIHRSVLVNIAFIKEVKPWFNDEYTVVLKDGTQLPVGRTYRKSIVTLLKM